MDYDYDAYYDDDFYEDRDEFADPGGNSALRAASASNPRNLPCPTCGRVHMTVSDLHRLLWEAAGVGSGAVMAEAPQVEMPTDAINEGLGLLLDGHGLPRRRCRS